MSSISSANNTSENSLQHLSSEVSGLNEKAHFSMLAKDLIQRPEVIITIIALAALIIVPIFLPTGIALAITIPTFIIPLVVTTGLLALRANILLSSNAAITTPFLGKNTKRVNTIFTTKDGIELAGSRTEIQTPPEDPAEKKIVFYFNANAQHSSVDFYDTGFRPFNPNLDEHYHECYSFDYRGCGNSKGRSPTHSQLVNDGVEIISHFIENEGIDPKNILIVGFSIGGTIAPFVKQKLDKKYEDQEPTALSVHRTTYSLEGILSCRFGGENNPISNAFYSFVRSTLTAITRIALSLVGWNFYLSAKDWDNLRGNKLATNGYQDVLFPAPLSLAYRTRVYEDKEQKDRYSSLFQNAVHETVPSIILPDTDESNTWNIPAEDEYVFTTKIVERADFSGNRIVIRKVREIDTTVPFDEKFAHPRENMFDYLRDDEYAFAGK